MRGDSPTIFFLCLLTGSLALIHLYLLSEALLQARFDRRVRKRPWRRAAIAKLWILVASMLAIVASAVAIILNCT